MAVVMALILSVGAVMPASDAADADELRADLYPMVEPGRKLVFPRDHGAHPDYRTEWWYITGWIENDGVARGFQVTFFRSRPGVQEDNKSAFAPKQLIFAHAAIADAANGQLIYDERVGREGFGLAYAKTDNTDVGIDGWTLTRGESEYHARIAADDFAFDLKFVPTQPVLLQGRSGFSAKGPAPGEASYYYSLPHLRVEGSAKIHGETTSVSGNAWLDHEWSSKYLSPAAQGWDWVSINFSDGGSLMAFRMRARGGSTLWAGGSERHRDGSLSIFSPDDVEFEPTKLWRSPRTDIEYPVAMRVRAGRHDLKVMPLMDDQELDSRASTGIVYWEGAVRASIDGESVGRGYLELTGYGDRPGI
jgi:predicted secreted hydrolase